MMISAIDMIEVINEQTGAIFQGEELEYFIDDTNDIGEVYLDGTLLYQSTSVFNENDIKIKFKEQFSVNNMETNNG